MKERTGLDGPDWPSCTILQTGPPDLAAAVAWMQGRWRGCRGGDGRHAGSVAEGVFRGSLQSTAQQNRLFHVVVASGLESYGDGSIDNKEGAMSDDLACIFIGF